jgi:hypothetical protein
MLFGFVVWSRLGDEFFIENIISLMDSVLDIIGSFVQQEVCSEWSVSSQYQYQNQSPTSWVDSSSHHITIIN